MSIGEKKGKMINAAHRMGIYINNFGVINWTNDKGVQHRYRFKKKMLRDEIYNQNTDDWSLERSYNVMDMDMGVWRYGLDVIRVMQRNTP